MKGHLGAAPLVSRVSKQKRKLKLYKQEATRLAQEEGYGGGRCHGFCVPNTGMGQGGGTRQKHPLGAGVAGRLRVGAERGRGEGGEQKWDPWERGRFTGTDRCKGFLKEAAVEGTEGVWRREITSFGVEK